MLHLASAFADVLAVAALLLIVLLLPRGELPEDMSTAYERQRKAYETLQRTVSTLADALEKPMPDLPEPSSVTHTKDGAIVVLTGRVCALDVALPMFLPAHCQHMWLAAVYRVVSAMLPWSG